MMIKKFWKKLNSHPATVTAEVVLASAYAENMKEELFANR